MRNDQEQIRAWCLQCQINSDEFAGPDRWEAANDWGQAHAQSAHDSVAFPFYTTTREPWVHIPEHEQILADLGERAPLNESDFINDELRSEITFSDNDSFKLEPGAAVAINACEHGCFRPGSGILLAYERIVADNDDELNEVRAQALVWRDDAELESVDHHHLTLA